LADTESVAINCSKAAITTVTVGAIAHLIVEAAIFVEVAIVPVNKA
jgi:hypothetical protein